MILGDIEGTDVGAPVGTKDGGEEGSKDGIPLRTKDGITDGREEGSEDGKILGSREEVGLILGAYVLVGENEMEGNRLGYILKLGVADGLSKRAMVKSTATSEAVEDFMVSTITIFFSITEETISSFNVGIISSLESWSSKNVISCRITATMSI